ncbi:hypothetical protein QBC35DRAFT_475386 [Podospora australis]|uniref:Uncharacterized protein n=1 Tax=Podospora australis TaxID=1536484 RepID=A0AAN6WSA7_9PEZI|nr:hypothetical protein QBC35DRAFT_475386 [Podospora australis]
MIPPVEDSVLQDNPEFAALYTTLTSVILNPDGSTRKDPAAKKRAAVKKQLDGYRLKAAKEHLLINAIATATPKAETPKPAAPTLRRTTRSQQAQLAPSPELPQPLLDLLLLLPPILSPSSSSIPPDQVTLLLTSPPLSQLPQHLPALASAVSTSLHASAVQLARIANPQTNPSFLHRAIPSLPAQASTLQDTLASRKANLTRSRLASATSVSLLLDAQIIVIAKLLKSLEAKHGPVARSLEYRITEVALEAEEQRLKNALGLVQARKEVYTPEAIRALRGYGNHLRDAKARLGERVNHLRAELEEYAADKGKEKVMREMGRVYKDMGRQVEEVRGDLERLGRA